MKPGFTVRALVVLWPAFAAAALIDGLVFAAVDPLDLRWFEGLPLGRAGLHTLAFVIFWLLISAASATSLLLLASHERRPPAS